MDRRNNFLFVVLLGTVGVLVLAILFRGGAEVGPRPDGPATPAAAGSGEAEPRAATVDPAARTEGLQPEADGSRRAVEGPAVPAGDRRVALRGRLVAAGGAPAADVELVWRQRSDFGFAIGGPAADGPRTRSAADGTFELRVEAGRRGLLELPRAAGLLFASREQRQVEVAAYEADADLGELGLIAAARIAGQVVDEAGQPVPSARVRANRDALAIWMPGQGEPVDGEGRFELIGLEPGRHGVGAEAPGFVPATATVELKSGEQVDGLVLRLARGASIAGTVLDDRGRPVAGARVAGFRDRELGPNVRVQGIDADAAVETDANGYFVLSGIEGEQVSLRAWAEGCASQTLAGVAVGTGNVTFRLDRLGRISGRLLDTEGRPLAGSQVSARVFNGAVRSGGPSSRLPDLDRLGGGDAAETDAEGRFELGGVRPGTVTLEARGPAHLPIEGYTVVVVAGATVANVTLRAETGAVLVASVVDPLGKPVAGALVEVTEPPRPAVPGAPGGRQFAVRAGLGTGPDAVRISSDGDPRLLREARTGADGSVRIGGLPSGPVRIRARSEVHAPSRPVDLAVPRRGALEAMLSLRPAGRVELRTVDGAGAPAGELGFVLRGPQGADAADAVETRGRTDAAGVAVVEALLEGRYTAVLELAPQPQVIGSGMAFVMAGAGGQELAATAQELAVRGGETAEVVLTKPLLARVHGVVQAADGPAPGVEIELRGAEAGPFGPGISAVSGPDGAFELRDVPAGSYRIEWGRPGQLVKDRAELEVPAGLADLRRDLELRGGSVRVTVVDGEGLPVGEAEVSLRRAGEAQNQQRGMMMVRSLSMDAGGGSIQSITMGGPARVRTGPDGVAQIDDVPPGEYRLVVEAEGHSEGRLEPVQVVDGQRTEAGTVGIAAAGTVRGVVTGFADGTELRIAMVEARRAGSEDEPRREVAMGGQFEIGRLEAGDWELRARPAGPGAAGAEPGPWQRVVVRAGEVAALDLPLGR
jgi:protocatechuate 3,4-dioxygenase beta subunit